MKNLVIISASDNSNFPSYTIKRGNSFEVAIVYYGDNPDNPPYDKSAYDYFIPIKGFKYQNIHKSIDLFKSKYNLDIIQNYDYIWLPDDDIQSDSKTIKQIFQFAYDNELYITQPSVRRNGYWSHDSETYNTAQRYEYDFKPSEVEIMMPIFSKEAFIKFSPLFKKAVTGWGLDSTWSHLSAREKKKIGVIHKYSVEHLRPVGSGEFYKTIDGLKLSPMDDLNKWAIEYDLYKPIDLSYQTSLPRTVDKITFCIPSKNNLRYLKNSIQSIKENSACEHDIIVFIDADNDGTELWCKENKVLYIKNKLDAPQGIATAYNRCIEIAKTDIVCMFHADMYMAKGFDIGILKHLNPKSIVSGTRIEPPLHPEGKEKIVKDFGMYPEDFKKDEFNDFVQKTIFYNKGKTTKGIFAPWACYKEDIMSIGLHDEQFHSYHEDSDMFNRFILSGYEIIQSWEAYVYHLTCRGGQFQDGIEQVTKDPAFHLMKHNAMKNYLRKWGSWIKNNEYQYPIISHKYDIAFKVINCSIETLVTLEPWCSAISSDTSYAAWIEEEQKNTNFNLLKRVKPWNAPLENDIIVEFDASKLNQESFNILTQLSDIITQSGEIGKFELSIFSISIANMDTYEHNLVHIYNK